MNFLPASVRFDAGMRVDVILQRRQRLETPLADAALVRPFLGVRFHVARQQISFWTSVIAVVAHVRLRHHLRFARQYFHYF